MAWTKEQLEAINKEGTNIIVSAGAGSGKTAVLTERVLRKLKSNVSISELLILTFTKAAASEMKERIRKKIKEDKNLKGELDKIDSAYITTFDSFALSIVRRYHYLLNISLNVSIIEQSIINLKKKEIMKEIFEDYYAKEDADFLKLINDFSVKDDEEILASILSINEKLDLKYDKHEYLKNYITNSYNDSKINDDIDAYYKLIGDKILQIKNNIIKLSSYVDNSYIEKINDSLEVLLNSDDYASLTNLSIKLPSLPRGTSEEAKVVKEEISNIVKDIKKLLEYGNAEQIKKDILSTKQYVQVIIKIINDFDKKILDFKFKNDAFEFNDIAKMAIDILIKNKNICEQLKTSFNEILVDEYQDTSDLQETFINLISNNNLYMVGDIKQSIYRFRNANPYIFKNKYDRYKNNDGGIKIDLNKNFRSRKEPLNNINEIFDLIMDDNIGGADYRNGHEMVYGNLTYQNEGKVDQNHDLEILEYEFDKKNGFTKEEIEIFTIVKDIKEKIKNKYQVFDKDDLVLRNATYKDFVILMDRTTNFELYKKIFEYLCIPLTIHKDEVISNNQNIMIIKNIITLIIKWRKKEIDEMFKYAFVSVARSYLFRYSDNEIFEHIRTNNYISDITKIIDSINTYENSNENIINEIIDKFEFYEKMVAIGDVESTIIALEYMLRLSENLSSMNYTLFDLWEYLNKITDEKYDIKFSLNKETGDTVNIMTIHKSKGLEYHICYFPGLYAKFNISDIKEKFTFDSSIGFITPMYNEGIGETIYKPLLKDKYLKEEISEKIRLFYVALTRAKEKMIMLRPLSSNYCELENGVVDNSERIKFMSFDNIMASIIDRLDKYVKIIDVEDLALTKDYNLVKSMDIKSNIKFVDNKIVVKQLEVEEQAIKKETFSKHSVGVLTNYEKQNIKYGKKLHQVLEYFDLLNPNYELINDEFCENIIRSFLKTDIFSKNILKIYHEYEFLYVESNIKYHGVIDLMIETDNEFDIVDFKLKNIVDKNYYKQLDGYKKYISSLTDKNVKIYLYSLIDGILEEIQ